MTDIVLLDGGMGQELTRRSKNPAHPQWGAWVMMNEPEIVQGLHEDYIRAGARAITINAYSINRSRLRKFNMPERLEELQGIAIDLASRARDACDSETTILGCLSPLVGSYHPELMRPEPETLEEYHEVVSFQADHVDAFICETMGSAVEARLAATAACESGKPVWVAWTLDEALGDDGQPRLRSGETVPEAIAALNGLPVEAILFNCTAPEAMTAGNGHPGCNRLADRRVRERFHTDPQGVRAGQDGRHAGQAHRPGRRGLREPCDALGRSGRAACRWMLRDVARSYRGTEAAA